MSAALLGNWSLLGALGLAVMARAFEGFGRRTIAIGPAGLWAAAMFVLSTICMNHYMIYPDEPAFLADQLFSWRYGLFIDALLYLAVLLLIAPLRGWIAAAIVTVIVGLHLVAISQAGVGAKQIAEGAQITLIAGLSVLCLLRVKKDDLIGLLLWGVLAINEIVSAMFYHDCQFAHGLFGTREAGAACEQVYGFDPTWAAIYLSAPLCAWFLFRWYRPRPS